MKGKRQDSKVAGKPKTKASPKDRAWFERKVAELKRTGQVAGASARATETGPGRQGGPGTVRRTGPHYSIRDSRAIRVLRRGRCGARIGGWPFEEFTTVSALLGFRQNLLSTEGTPFRCFFRDRRRRGRQSFGLAGPHGFQLRVSVDNVLLGPCRSVDGVTAIRAHLGIFADSTGALWAFRASGESQCKSDGTEQDPKAEPQAAVCTPIAGNDSGTDAEQKPDYEKFHNVVFITLYGPMVRQRKAGSGGSFLRGFRWQCPDGTMPLVMGAKNHLTLYGSHRPEANKYAAFKVVTPSTEFTWGFQR